MYNRNLNIMIQKANNNKDIGSKKNFVSGLIFYCYANPSVIIYFHLKALTLSYDDHKKLTRKRFSEKTNSCVYK